MAMATREASHGVSQGHASASSPIAAAVPRRGWLQSLGLIISLALLLINYFLSQYDKFILSYFQSSVMETLGLTATQYGLLSGYSTGVVYALLALPVAFVADWTHARVWTLSLAAGWWSLCVVFQGLAHSFAEVFCARLAMGIGQAAVEALTVSIISDLVAWRNVFLAESVFYVGVYIGEAISGQIATSFTRSHTSWQVAMRAVGITGLVVALLLRLVLREPARQESLAFSSRDASKTREDRNGTAREPDSSKELDSTEGSAAELDPTRPGSAENDPRESILEASTLKRARIVLKSTISYLVRMRSFGLLVVSASMRQLAGNVFGYYMPGYLSSSYPNEPDLLSRYGIIVGAVGSASVLCGGLLTSLLWHRTKLTPLYLTAVGGMISSVFVLLMIFSSELGGVEVLYGVMSAAYLTAETWLGCLFALVILLLPPAFKTFAFAIWGSIQALVYSSGPEIIGLALQNSDPGSVRYMEVTRLCLSVIIVTGYWVAGIGFLFAIPLVKRDIKHEFIRGPLNLTRRMSFVAASLTLAIIVASLFVLSLVFGI